MEAILEFIKEYGVLGFLIIVIILFIQEPDRAVKIKAQFIQPFFRLFKWGSRQYIASEVGYTINQYMQRHLSKLVPSIPNPKIKIKWVTSPSDPVFQADGTLILRLKETNDQTRNILAATRVSLPRIVCPTLRPNLSEYAESAIDLTVLKNLTDRLGKHAYPVFQRYFLGPEIEEDQRAALLFSRLVQLDDTGIFVSILLDELNLLGDYLFSIGDSSDTTTEVINLVEFLIGLATRDVGQLIELEYISDVFNIGIMILARSWKADTEGLPPYIRRIDKKIKIGCESLYIASYPQARSFLRRLNESLDSDERLMLIKRNSIYAVSSSPHQKRGFSDIVLYRRNPIFTDSTFAENIDIQNIQEGDRITGTVFDVSQNSAMVDIGGMYGVVSLEDSSWHTHRDCKDIFQEGTESQFLVKSIDFEKDTIFLSRKIPDSHPWEQAEIPAFADVIGAKAILLKGGHYICLTEEDLEVLLPIEETKGEGKVDKGNDLILGTHQQMRIIEINSEERTIIASIRRLDEEPWHIVHSKLPAGSEHIGAITEIRHNSVLVSLPNKLIGYIPSQYITEAGYDFNNYVKGLEIGNELQVTISKVFIEKRKVRLDIPRKRR